MNGTFRFFGSNSLIFRAIENVEIKNDFNSLYGDIDYRNKFFLDYIQKVQQSDNLWFQFRTNYPTFSFTLVDSNGGEASLSHSIVEVLDDTINYVVNIDVSSLTGCYYVKLYAPGNQEKATIDNIRSNCFNIQSLFENTAYLKWNGNYAYDDGMIWGDEMQELRIDGTLIDDMSGSEISIMRDSNNNLIKTNYSPIYKKKLQVGVVSFEAAHLLNRIFGHDLLVVNEMVFNNEKSFDFGDRLGGSQAYKPSIELELNNYENYSEDDIIQGDIPPLQVLAIMASNGKGVMSESEKGIRTS